MKRNLPKIITALILVLSIMAGFSGCENPTQPDPSDPGTDTGGGDLQNPGTGTLSVSIPTVAPWLDELFSADSGGAGFDGSRAFAVAGRVVLSVYDSASNLVGTPEEFTPGTFADEGLTRTMELAVGTGYTLDVDIYNDYESATDPTVTGTSAAFDISEGQTTDVTVTCTPASPTELTLGAGTTSFTQTNHVVDAESSITATGGETWISFTAPANGSVMFTVDIPDTLAIGIALYDAQGMPASGLNSRESDGALYFTGLTGSALHYGLVIIADQTTTNQAEQSFTLAAAQGYSISGTITVPGVTDAASLPGAGDFGTVFIIPTLTAAQPSLGDMVSVIFLENPVVAAGNLEYSYTMGYDGNETAVLASGIIADTANWPAEGDYFGVAPGNVGTELDLLNMTGIETYTFSDDLTGVDFTLELLGDPAPEYDGLYGGTTAIVSSDTGNPVDASAGVWTLDVSGSTATVTFLTVTGEYSAAGTFNPATGEFSLIHDFTTPQVITSLINGTVATDGTVTGTGSYDYDSNGTVEETISLTGEKNDSGYIVRGTMTIPYLIDWSGEPYWAALDLDHDGSNGQVANGGSYTSTSNQMCFIMLNVPAGSYYLYGAVNLSSETWSQPLSGDYFGSYDPDAASVTVSDNSGVYDFDITPDYWAMSELLDNWYLPDDGYSTQEFEFSYPGSPGTEVLLHYGRPNLTSPSDSGYASMAYIDGDSNTAVLYLYYHPDPSQENSYVKFSWTEPVTGTSTTSDFTLYTNSFDFQTALGETTLQDDSYPLTADTEAPSGTVHVIIN